MMLELSSAELNRLKRLGWEKFVGRGRGLWVRASTQRVYLIRCGSVLNCFVCSTARAGLGNRRNSFRTPTGWHEIAQKVGSSLPRGAVLRGRKWTGDIWRLSGRNERRDLILTRILRLAGLENGRNQGGNFDTWERMIYFHGTNVETRLGTPVSHGCIRLSNKDIAALFDLVRVGCRVLITK
jgi:UDP-N-acetylmuramate--alanine ligase